MNANTANVRSPGAGQDPSAPAGYGYQFYSGPGAAYGPGGVSPTRGLVDEGKPPGSAYDSPEYRPPGGNDAGPAGKPKGGGRAHTSFAGAYQPYQGMQSHPQFVDWQPSPPGMPVQGATRFVGGGPSSTTPAPPPAPGKPGKGGGKSPAAAPGGAGGGTGAGAGRPPLTGAGGPGAGQRPGGAGTGAAPQDGSSIFKPGIPGQNVNHPDLRGGIFGGVDTNYLDYRTPGWLRDPTTGTYNTSGFPNATPFAPNSNNRGGANQAFDAYVTALHDAGFGTDDIMSLVGPYGYRLDDRGDWQWGWGTGPTVSTGAHGGGYTFARDASGGGKGGNSSDKPNAADRLTQGWTPTAQYV